MDQAVEYDIGVLGRGQSPPPRQRSSRRQVSEEPRKAGAGASLARQGTLHPLLGRRGCLTRRHPECTAQLGSAAPEERWWLYTMTVATTGQAMQKGLGWRKALRAAIADNPFVKGEGLSPKARRELLSHSQLTLPL